MTLRRFDWSFFLATLALILVGVVMIYSAYEASLPPMDRHWTDNAVFRQLLFAGVGLIAYFFVAAIDYRHLSAFHRWTFGLVVLALGATMVIGNVAFGGQRWIRFETFGIQPSELSKVLMITVLARYLSGEEGSLDSPLPFLASMVLAIVPAILIYRQPNFGTALIVVVTWVGMSFLAGVRWQHIALLACLGLVAIPVVWFQMEDYMRDRILLFLFPDPDPSGSSYNINQALISIGSGGLWGKGFLQGTQSQLHFLRVRHTDFIFSVLGEEFGFAGSVILIGLFAFLILRLVRIAMLARDTYGRLIAGGVATMLLAQTVINLGMNANILPVTGLPLPLVSAGGSSLTATLLALGLAQSVYTHHRGFEPRSKS